MNAITTSATVASVLLGAATAFAQTHPLDPLSTNELTAVAMILRTEGKAATNYLFPLAALHEPPKDEVLAWKPGFPFRREAFAVVLDPRGNRTFEAVVDLNGHSVVSWKQIPGVQPIATGVEEEAASELVREHPAWQAALRRRGITNSADVYLLPWAPGHHPLPGQKDGRFKRVFAYFRGTQGNTHGRPIEGIEAIVDLTALKVIEVIDSGARPIPKESTDFFDERVRGTSRPALKPLVITQPQGPSFTINGNEIHWDRWRFRYGFHPREGLVLYLVTYEDEGRERSILHRASISEMLVPYGDPGGHWFWRNAFDVGEYGLGKCGTPLEPGRNCPSYATLLDVPVASDLGVGELRSRRVNLYEREGDTLWSHQDFTAGVEGRRARELVIGFTSTLGNYDYAFLWIFRQDASIEFVAELTGIILTKGATATQCEVCKQRPGKAGIVEPTGEDRVGTLVAPNTIGVNHQHFINMRLDFDVDGTSNSVKEINVHAARSGRGNPHGNTFVATQTVFGKERQTARDVNFASHRTWAVFNPGATTALGHDPTYVLEPGENALPFLATDSVVRKFAGFIDHHFFATRYQPSELNAAGPYPTHAPKPDNLITWTGNNESLLNEDVVVWYTFGVTHVPRSEDYPVMPAARAGFKLLPKSFFNRNPSLDVPAPGKGDPVNSGGLKR